VSFGLELSTYRSVVLAPKKIREAVRRTSCRTVAGTAVARLRNHRREPCRIRAARQGRAANAARRSRRIVVRISAVARLEVGNADRVGTAEELRIGEGAEQADATDAGVPGITDEQGADRRPFLVQISVVRLKVVADVEALVVERQAEIHVDGAGETALEPVGRLFLVDFDRAEKLGRNVLEVDALAVNAGREGVTPVEFRSDEGQAPDGDPGAFHREVVRIAGSLEAVDRDAGNALQRLGDRTIGESADVLRRDRVDDCIRIALDLL